MEEVLRRFARLAGLTVEEAEQWQDLCGDAYVLLESQRKKQKDASCVGDLVCAAAAACAFLTTAKVWSGQNIFGLRHAVMLLRY